MKTVFTLYTSNTPVITHYNGCSFQSLSYDGRRICKAFSRHIRRYFPYIFDSSYNIIIKIETSGTVTVAMYDFLIWLVKYYLLNGATITEIHVIQSGNGYLGKYKLTIETKKESEVTNQ